MASLRDTAIVAAVYLYFTGFWYISVFHEQFGLTTPPSDTPVYYYFVYCYRVLFRLRALEIAILFILLSSTLAANIRLSGRKTRTAAVLAGAAMLLLYLGHVAEKEAVRHAHEIRAGQGLVPVTLALEPAATSGLPKQLYEWNEQSELALLGIGHDNVIVFRQAQPSTGHLYGTAEVVLVPREKIAAIQIFADQFNPLDDQ